MRGKCRAFCWFRRSEPSVSIWLPTERLDSALLCRPKVIEAEYLPVVRGLTQDLRRLLPKTAQSYRIRPRGPSRRAAGCQRQVTVRGGAGGREHKALAVCGPALAHGLFSEPTVKVPTWRRSAAWAGWAGRGEQSKLSDRWEARMTFPNLPVATVRVARITLRDRSQRGTQGDSLKKLCSRLSTRYRWWWQYGLSGPYGTSESGFTRSHEQQDEVGSR